MCPCPRIMRARYRYRGVRTQLCSCPQTSTEPHRLAAINSIVKLRVFKVSSCVHQGLFLFASRNAITPNLGPSHTDLRPGI